MPADCDLCSETVNGDKAYGCSETSFSARTHQLAVVACEDHFPSIEPKRVHVSLCTCSRLLLFSRNAPGQTSLAAPIATTDKQSEEFRSSC